MEQASAGESATTQTPASATSGKCPCCGGKLAGEAAYRGPDRVLDVAGEFEIHVCSSCGTGVTSPFVADADLAELYVGDYPNHDATSGSGAERGFIPWLRRMHRGLIARTPPLSSLRHSTGTLLDVGCGNAVFTRIIADEGWNVVGIEPDPAICEVARLKIDDVREGDIKTAALEPHSFDAVLFNHTLEHVASPIDDLRRAHELLKPGGMLLIAVPHFGNWQRRVFGDKWLMLELPRHRTHFTAKGLNALVERAGFEGVQTKFGTATGLVPASVLIAATGSMRAAAGRLVSIGLLVASAIVALPVIAINKLTRDGEVITLVARRPAG